MDEITEHKNEIAPDGFLDRELFSGTWEKFILWACYLADLYDTSLEEQVKNGDNEAYEQIIAARKEAIHKLRVYARIIRQPNSGPGM